MDMQLSDNYFPTINVEVQKPKKILHFSDGTLEEFSDDDEDEMKNESKQEVVADPVVESELEWGPWIRYKSWQMGSTALAGCDYLGEALASILGITTPKYAYEIKEYSRRQKEQEIVDKEKKEFAAWHESRELNPNCAITTERNENVKRF